MGLPEQAARLRSEYPSVKKIALSFSGGLDSVVVGELLSSAGFEVLPVAVDVGQHSDFSRMEKNARKMFGSFVLKDARERFAENALRALKASFGSRGSLNSDGISRPAMAHALAEAARKHVCQAIAHGSSGLGNSHLAMENSLRVLAPEMRIIAPVRDLDLRRDETLEFARDRKLLTNLARAEKISADENLWGRTIRQGFAIDPSAPLPEEAFKWTVSPRKAPAKPSNVVLEFSAGIPVAAEIDGKKTSARRRAPPGAKAGLSGIKGNADAGVSIFEALNEIGGKHGVGRADFLDDKEEGLKSREGYECPGAMILLAAHRELDSLTLTTRELEAKRQMEAVWSSLVHQGGWYTRLRRSLDAFMDEVERPVEGTVSLELYKGGIYVRGRKSAHSLYDSRLSGRDSHGAFSQKETRQFAKLHGLQDVMAYMIGAD